MGKSCNGCVHYLGGGACRINLESECGAGGHEAWEPMPWTGRVGRTTPCKGCVERRVGCHSECGLYAAWRRDMDAINAQARREREANGVLAAGCVREIERMRKMDGRR